MNTVCVRRTTIKSFARVKKKNLIGRFLLRASMSLCDLYYFQTIKKGLKKTLFVRSDFSTRPLTSIFLNFSPGLAASLHNSPIASRNHLNNTTISSILYNYYIRLPISALKKKTVFITI